VKITPFSTHMIAIFQYMHLLGVITSKYKRDVNDEDEQEVFDVNSNEAEAVMLINLSVCFHQYKIHMMLSH
jgi:hypothetical protein